MTIAPATPGFTLVNPETLSRAQMQSLLAAAEALSAERPYSCPQTRDTFHEEKLAELVRLFGPKRIPAMISVATGRLFAHHDDVCRADEPITVSYSEIEGCYSQLLEFVDADLEERRQVCLLLGADTTYLTDQYGDIEGFDDEGDDEL